MSKKTTLHRLLSLRLYYAYGQNTLLPMTYDNENLGGYFPNPIQLSCLVTVQNIIALCTLTMVT